MRTQKLALHAIPAEQSRTQLAAERDSAIQRAEANARAYQQAAARYQVLAGDHTALTDAHSSLVTAHAQLVQDFSQRPRVTVVRSGPTPLVRNAFLANISNRAANSLPDEDAIDRNYRRRY